MTSIVLKNPVTGHENGEEISVIIQTIEYDTDNNVEIIETDKGVFVRTLDYSPNDPYGWIIKK